MKPFHKEMAGGRWMKIPFLEQMAHTGSEMERAITWSGKGNRDYARQAFFRAIELLDLTIGDKKNLSRLKELTRLREMLADFFFFDNEYKSSASGWQKYFHAFMYASRSRR